jgi:hypothetical protein
MKYGFSMCIIFLALLLALAPMQNLFAQNPGSSATPGTSSQQGTPSQQGPPAQGQNPPSGAQYPYGSNNPSQTGGIGSSNQGDQGYSNRDTTPVTGETQTGVPQAGIGNTAPSPAARQVGWVWLILGFLIGLVVGAVVWRRPGAVVYDDSRRDRIA